MTENDNLAARFEAERPRLHGVGYRMLGSHAEADDAVQNTWLRLSRADSGQIENLDGWLTTVLARECLRMLRTRRHRSEEPLDESTGSAGYGRTGNEPEEQVLMADTIGPALMVVLDSLAPAERLAFVLHDVFAMPFSQIAEIIERSPAATRQLASRARRRVQGATPPVRADLVRQRRVVDAFLSAIREGDFEGLVTLLDPDIVLHDDNPTPPAVALTRGARDVGAQALRYRAGARYVRPALVHGQVGLAIIPGGRIIGALAFAVHSGRITRIDVISEPEQLRHVDTSALDDGTDRIRPASADGAGDA